MLTAPQQKAPGVSYFGANEEIYTPDQIMRTTLNKAAVAINELFRQSVSYPTLSWDDLDAIHRESKISAADHILMKIRILLSDETLVEVTPAIIRAANAEYIENKKLAEPGAKTGARRRMGTSKLSCHGYPFINHWGLPRSAPPSPAPYS